jgi:hypothetical protein
MAAARVGMSHAPSSSAAAVRIRGVAHAKRDGADRGCAARRLAHRVGVAVDDDVHVALAIEDHLARPMPRHLGESHLAQEAAERERLARGVLDELDAPDCRADSKGSAGVPGPSACSAPRSGRAV